MRMVLGAVIVLGFAWILFTGWFPQDPGPVGLPSANALLIGDCFVTEGIAQLPVACDQPHDGEVFGVARWSGSSEFPGDDGLEAWANASCAPLFEPYVGVSLEATELNVGMLYPTAATWSEGDRIALCIVRAPAGVGGSVADSMR